MITFEWVHVPIWCRVDCLIAGLEGDVFTLSYFKVVDGYILLGVAGLPSIVFTTGPTDGVSPVCLSVRWCLFAWSILFDFTVA